jgi:hypothetical protein
MFPEDLHRATYASVRTEGTLWDDTLSLSWDEPRLRDPAPAFAGTGSGGSRRPMQ